MLGLCIGHRGLSSTEFTKKESISLYSLDASSLCKVKASLFLLLIFAGFLRLQTLDMETKSDVDIMKDYPKEPVADLVHIVRQRRIMAAKQAARKDEEERKNKERFASRKP